jgi:hypothetical protein
VTLEKRSKKASRIVGRRRKAHQESNKETQETRETKIGRRRSK